MDSEDFDRDARSAEAFGETVDGRNRRFRNALRALRKNVDALESSKDSEPVAPEVGGVYLTMNDSIVIVTEVVTDSGAKCLVVKGGHGTPANGEAPGEFYYLDPKGYFKMRGDGAELTMSLRQKLPPDLSRWLEDAEPTDPEDSLLRRLRKEPV